MSDRATRIVRAGLTLACCAFLLQACGTPGQDLDLRTERAPAPAPETQMGAEVGRLLSPDEDVSRGAERRLRALTGADLDRFLAYARRLGDERDPRLLNLLDEHHALPDLPTDERLAFLLWKSRHPDRYYVMKAQSRLLDMARADPEALIARLQEGGPDVEVLGVVLAQTGTEAAVPVLLERYRHAGDPRARAAAAEALGMLVGEARRPRPSGRQLDIDRDADALEAWYLERLELRDQAPPTDPPTEGENR